MDGCLRVVLGRYARALAGPVARDHGGDTAVTRAYLNNPRGRSLSPVRCRLPRKRAAAALRPLPMEQTIGCRPRLASAPFARATRLTWVIEIGSRKSWRAAKRRVSSRARTRTACRAHRPGN